MEDPQQRKGIMLGGGGGGGGVVDRGKTSSDLFLIDSRAPGQVRSISA